MKALGSVLFLALIGGASAATAGVAPISCMLAPMRESRIGSDQAGIVAALDVRRTDRVTAGQVLVQLDDRLARADVERAQLTRDALKSRLDRSEGLTRNNVISRDDYEKLRTDYAVSEAELSAARQRLAKLAIIAPFDGLVSEVKVEEGELTGSAPLLTLIDMSVLKAVIVLPSEAFGTLKIGDRLTLASTVTGSASPAEVYATDPFIDPAANTFSVFARLDNPGLTIPAGSACRVQE